MAITIFVQLQQFPLPLNQPKTLKRFLCDTLDRCYNEKETLILHRSFESQNI